MENRLVKGAGTARCLGELEATVMVEGRTVFPQYRSPLRFVCSPRLSSECQKSRL